MKKLNTNTYIIEKTIEHNKEDYQLYLRAVPEDKLIQYFIRMKSDDDYLYWFATELVNCNNKEDFEDKFKESYEWLTEEDFYRCGEDFLGSKTSENIFDIITDDLMDSSLNIIPACVFGL